MIMFFHLNTGNKIERWFQHEMHEILIKNNDSIHNTFLIKYSIGYVT